MGAKESGCLLVVGRIDIERVKEDVRIEGDHLCLRAAS